MGKKIKINIQVCHQCGVIVLEKFKQIHSRTHSIPSQWLGSTMEVEIDE
jgi:hypothetical protein